MRLAQFFQLDANRTTVRHEILGGVTTFLAMSYIIFVNPGVLSQAGMDFRAVMYATCLSAALATFLMGLVANYPWHSRREWVRTSFSSSRSAPPRHGFWPHLAAGAGGGPSGRTVFHGSDAFRASLQDHRFHSGLPEGGNRGGHRLFITLIGLEYGSLIVSSPATLVRLGDFRNPVALVSVLGLLIMILLLAYRIRGAILLGFWRAQDSDSVRSGSLQWSCLGGSSACADALEVRSGGPAARESRNPRDLGVRAALPGAV